MKNISKKEKTVLDNLIEIELRHKKWDEDDNKKASVKTKANTCRKIDMKDIFEVKGSNEKWDKESSAATKKIGVKNIKKTVRTFIKGKEVKNNDVPSGQTEFEKKKNIENLNNIFDNVDNEYSVFKQIKKLASKDKKEIQKIILNIDISKIDKNVDLTLNIF